ncbi:MAG: permease [Firmicutes bacterium]|nr:permease [Bacillota bacterium]
MPLLLLFIFSSIMFAAFLFGKSFMQDFTTIFFSIILEALPYILAGTLISSLIEVFVGADTIKKVLPRGLFPGLLLGAAAGLIFPVCECGIIPVARRLIQKGVPVPVAVSFMLATPVVNPVVLASTAAAFNDPAWALARGFLAYTIAVWCGVLVNRLASGNQLKSGGQDCGGCCAHLQEHRSGRGREVLVHAAGEFLNLSCYLIIGAFIAAAAQVAVPRHYLLAFGANPLSSCLAMMALAYGLSLCSEADAFVAATFQASFTHGSILAFLLLGPMLDLKNTLMLFGTFRSRFVALISIILVLDVLAVALAVNLGG